MKKLIIITSLLFLFQINFRAQETYTNRGFVNISKFSLHSVHRFDEIRDKSGTEYSIRENNSMAFGFETINGWFLFPWLSAGIGVGYDYYNIPKHSTFPLYLDLRTYFDRKGNCFYLNFDIGTLIPFDSKYSKGQVVNLGIGYKFSISQKLNMQLGIVANSKMFNVSGFPEPKPIHEYTANSVSFDIGIMF